MEKFTSMVFLDVWEKTEFPNLQHRVRGVADAHDLGISEHSSTIAKQTGGTRSLTDQPQSPRHEKHILLHTRTYTSQSATDTCELTYAEEGRQPSRLLLALLFAAFLHSASCQAKNLELCIYK